MIPLASPSPAFAQDPLQGLFLHDVLQQTKATFARISREGEVLELDMTSCRIDDPKAHHSFSQGVTRWNRQMSGTNREMFTAAYDAFSKDDMAQLGHLKS